MTWLDELKGNSAVIVVNGYGDFHGWTIGKVVRTTKTKIFLESGKVYSRNNGLMSPRNEHSATMYRIEEATPEAVERINKARHEYDLQGQMLRFFDTRKNIQKLSISQMERIVGIINEEKL